jgi:hypothetical protein
MTIGEIEEPYCDVCGNAGADLRTPVEVCRDCYDIARDPPPGVDVSDSRDLAQRAVERSLIVRYLRSVGVGRSLLATGFRASAESIENGEHLK